MKVLRRLALYVALPLALAVVAGYSWYQLSDTGKRWRYEDKLATFCGGLIPYEESEGFTRLDTESGLTRDFYNRGDGQSYYSCRVGNTDITIGHALDSAADTDSRDLFDNLNEAHSDTEAVPLGGGWSGYTDLENTAVVLACTNREASVVVTAMDPDASPGGSHAIAELLAATAVNAAEQWDCGAAGRGEIPPLPAAPQRKDPSQAKGTCRGLPLHGVDYVHWIMDAPASRTAPLETCVLGETQARDEELFHLEAAFGPFAQRRLSDIPLPARTKRDAGGATGDFWATARCPGSGARAVFMIHSTEYVHIAVDDFAREALSAFAERAAKRHGCTDLKLPR